MNTLWFLTLADAAEKMEACVRCQNEARPHGTIGNEPPILLQKSRRHAQPAAVAEGRKLYRPAVQHMVSDQAILPSLLLGLATGLLWAPCAGLIGVHALEFAFEKRIDNAKQV